ncbi:MAG: SUMF1/EgtB/PvdO family nonheme iron enzyme [Chloroflexota bacterium]
MKWKYGCGLLTGILLVLTITTDQWQRTTVVLDDWLQTRQSDDHANQSNHNSDAKSVESRWGAMPPRSPMIGPEWFDPRYEITFVYVPAGEFIMGSDEQKFDESPSHLVDVDSFWIMRTEVTNAQYKRCVDGGGCSASYDERWQNPSRQGHPVTYVSFQQASEYAQWVGGRLPTEAEWEKAARGTDGRPYPWGVEPPTAEHLNYNRHVDDTQPVGTYAEYGGPYGTVDMAGNVLEWVADWYDKDTYTAQRRTNPTGPADGDFHLLRGGSWLSTADFVRTTTRMREPPYGDIEETGIRVIRVDSTDLEEQVNDRQDVFCAKDHSPIHSICPSIP